MSTKSTKLILAFDAKRLFNNFTGLGNYSRSLVRHLQLLHPEHEYHLFTPKAIHSKETDYFFNKDKFTIHIPSSKNPLWRTFGMAKAVNNLNPDIFHGLSHEIPFGIEKHIKTVVTFHDLIYEIYPHQFGWWDRNMYRLKYRSASYRTQFITAVSESTKRDLVNLYQILPDKIQVLYQSCGDAFQHIESCQSKYPLPEHIQDYYLYVGSIIERKGLLTIIKAYVQLPEKYKKPFVVVGKGNNAYFDLIMDTIRLNKLENFIYFINDISNHDLVHLYDNAFCLIYPSVYEGFGIPVIEALFRKKPVITSDISSLPEAGGPGAILINPHDSETLQQAIAQLHESNTYQQLANNGYLYVKNRFSAEVTTEALNNYYLKITRK